MEGCAFCEAVLEHRETGLLIFRGWATCLALLYPVEQYGFLTASDGYAHGRLSTIDYYEGRLP